MEGGGLRTWVGKIYIFIFTKPLLKFIIYIKYAILSAAPKTFSLIAITDILYHIRVDEDILKYHFYIHQYF